MLEYSNGRWVLQARAWSVEFGESSDWGSAACLLQTATNTRPSGQPRSFERYKVEAGKGEQIWGSHGHGHWADVSCQLSVEAQGVIGR